MARSKSTFQKSSESTILFRVFTEEPLAEDIAVVKQGGVVWMCICTPKGKSSVGFIIWTILELK